MKKVSFFLAFILILMVGSAFGDSLALKATWTPNTDAVTTGYKLYRTDGARTLIATIPGKTPTQPYLFNITVASGSTGTATFVITATSATKESADSNVASYPFDLSPAPAIVVGLGVTNQ